MRAARAATAAMVGCAAWLWRARKRREAATQWSPPGGMVVEEALPARVVGEGPVRLVLLHGMFNSGLYWGAAYDDLADTGRVIVPDLLGFGRSRRPQTGYTADAHADAVADTLRHLGAEGPLVVGAHSIGSLIGLRLALRHPDLVAGIVAFAPPIYPDARSARHHITSSDPLARLFLANEDWSRRLCRFMCRYPRTAGWLMRLARPTLPAPLARDRVEHSWASYHESLTNLVLAAEASTWLAEADIAVRMVVGTRDAALDHPFLAHLARAHPHVTLTVIDDAGHDLPLTHADVGVGELAEALNLLHADLGRPLRVTDEAKPVAPERETPMGAVEAAPQKGGA